MPITFDRLNTSKTISKEIVEIIKDNLVNGELKPGDKLPTEKELIEQLGVSRTPVREAIKILESLGVIQIKRGEGMFVTEKPSQLTLNPLIFSLIMHSTNVHKLIEFRQHFEVLLLNMLLTKKNLNIERIEAVYQSQIERMNPSLSPEELVDIDLEFHHAVLEETDNPFLTEIGRTIYELIRPRMIHFKHSKNIERTLATHKTYLDYLKGKDDFHPTEAVRWMIQNNEEMIQE
ncbi:hypothetical protein GCM10007216_03670 [Thalassobacillus devorans]|uniref:HTH gntR-type domain-containing protein n=1 Tax=Thalassobacillus devorans TaxID=279813 RepID=A0ABQ1NGI1_9BACI|nr:GntR family transcriptional regulator [Thalassobacillus devorans]NIK27276.1 DNA-binding FadR family transcriptional regulator [Thalassobacillus devorans]GGC76383.1 hypothetical protein GCM10007216_03670 [Thalassobacillus devorans]